VIAIVGIWDGFNNLALLFTGQVETHLTMVPLHHRHHHHRHHIHLHHQHPLSRLLFQVLMVTIAQLKMLAKANTLNWEVVQ